MFLSCLFMFFFFIMLTYIIMILSFSPAACFSNNHYTGIGSPSPNVLAFKSDTVE